MFCARLAARLFVLWKGLIMSKTKKIVLAIAAVVIIALLVVAGVTGKGS